MSCGSSSIRSCWDRDTGCSTTARIWVPSSSPAAVRMTTASSRSPINRPGADAGCAPHSRPKGRPKGEASAGEEDDMKVNSISGITCYVEDISKTAEFYEAIGFRRGKEEPDRVTFYVNWFFVTFVAQDRE